MDKVAFGRWLAGIGELDGAQRMRALAALTGSEAECLGAARQRSADAGATVPSGASSGGPAEMDLMAQVGRERIARFGCPHCDADEVQPWGKAGGKPRYRCKNCRKTFNPLTGTPLSGLRYRERWGDQAQALIAGETIAKAAERCKVDYTTAFRWRHRFLAALSQDKPSRLSGIVEADETFIIESFKGKRKGMPRAARKRGGKAAKRGLSEEQIPVMVARDRSGATIDAVLPRLNAANIAAALGHVIERQAELCCDGGVAIKAFARRAGLAFHVLPAPGGPTPQAPDLHINNVNAYHGRLKEWMRRFHGVATANLPNYLGWRRTIEALPKAPAPNLWIMAAAGLGPYQQATQ